MSGQDEIGEMRGFVDEFELGGFEHIADQGAQIWGAFGVSAQPSFVFINDNGEISRQIGGAALEDITRELDLLVDT